MLLKGELIGDETLCSGELKSIDLILRRFLRAGVFLGVFNDYRLLGEVTLIIGGNDKLSLLDPGLLWSVD